MSDKSEEMDSPGKSDDAKTSGSAKQQTIKGDKLSKALRDNLMRRKQQSRARNTTIRKFDK